MRGNLSAIFGMGLERVCRTKGFWLGAKSVGGDRGWNSVVKPIGKIKFGIFTYECNARLTPASVVRLESVV